MCAAAVGIDLGTTFSAVAYVKADGVPEVIPDAVTKDAVLPSVISFADGRPLVGSAAKEAQADGETEVAALFKRSMGDPRFQLYFGEQAYSATDLSALVLGHLKVQAEQGLGATVSKAVVSVPAYFTHPQREATKEAGLRAGLDVLKIVNEPTAAALAYGLRPQEQRRRVLVYDLGGGTFDVSLVEITADDLLVVGTGGDHRLGGRDWDERLAIHLQEQFARLVGTELPEEDENVLLARAESLKKTLSARKDAGIRLAARAETVDCVVTRTEFEELTRDLLHRTQQLTEQVLADAGLDWTQIDGMIPVGGSTRMPMVRECIERMSGRPPLGGVHPDQAVALGAAIQAELLAPRETPERLAAPRRKLPGSRALRDVTAHSLGMIAESSDRSRYVNSVLIERNMAVPARRERPYGHRLRPDQDNLLEIFLTQGETDDPQDCVYLGRYVVTGFSHGSGAVEVEIAYEYDHDAVVHVSATEKGTGASLTVTVGEVPDDVPERFRGRPPEHTARGELAVYLAIDLSGSMGGRPLAEAKKAAESFVGECDLSRTSIGLIGFSDRVEVYQRATRDGATIRAAIGRLKAGKTGYGNGGQPFDRIHDLLRDETGSRYAVVLTDGRWYHRVRDAERARRCHHDGIETIAIGFGSADEKFLRDIASSSEQSLFTDLGGLTEAFSTIARELTDGRGRGLSDVGAKRGSAHDA